MQNALAGGFSVDNAGNRILVQLEVADFLALENHHGYPLTESRRPIAVVVDIAHLQIQSSPDNQHQFFHQNFTQMASGPTVYLYF